MTGDPLRRRIVDIAREAGADAVAVACYDFEHSTHWALDGERWFHAASTIKVPVLLGVFAAVERGELELHSRVHVRNRFLSIGDDRPFRVESARDANGRVHAARGRTLQVGELAYDMITTSSNLATNLLVDVVGVEAIRRTLAEQGLRGIEFRRGVEDEAAWERGINNRVTANGLLEALRRIEEGRAISAQASGRMLEILHDQAFRSGIPAGLPEEARVAHKTGEMSTVAHDAGIVYLGGRSPYVVVILTEWSSGSGAGRSRTIASISRAVYEHLAAEASTGG